jgi:GTP-binding protein
LEEEQEEGKIRIAIVGRPNAGKSSIVNALLNTDRVIVSDVSGTTRDSIDSYITYKDKEYIIVDTAGIRKKSKVDYGVEKFAVDRAIRSIRECDIAVLVIDAKEGISDQDKKISSIITEAGKGLIVAINKWDLVDAKQANTINKFEKELSNDIPFLNFAPKIFISAVTKQRLGQIFEKSADVYEQCTKRVSTGLLNKVINEAYALNPPTSFKGKRLKIYYTTQPKIQPPTFVLFVNNEELLKDSYKRYIENKLREAFGFFGTPIRITVRNRSDKD